MNSKALKADIAKIIITWGPWILIYPSSILFFLGQNF